MSSIQLAGLGRNLSVFVAVDLSDPSWTFPRWFQSCSITPPPVRHAAQREPHSDVLAPRQSKRSAPACWRAQLSEHCDAIAALRRSGTIPTCVLPTLPVAEGRLGRPGGRSSVVRMFA